MDNQIIETANPETEVGFTEPTEYIYGLFAGEQCIYVGRTIDLDRRYNEHIRESFKRKTLKQKVIYRLIKDGVDIDIKVLEQGPMSKMVSKEDLWMTNMMGSGHPLTNSKAGDTDNYRPNVHRPPELSAWSIDQFLQAEWLDDQPGAKKNEKTAWIRGVAFYKTGAKKLRFTHPNYGTWEVEAWGGLPQKIAKAVKMLTPGTKEHEKLQQQIKQRDALAPRRP